MGRIFESKENERKNKDKRRFKQDVDDIDIDSINFNKPAEMKAWATKVMNMIKDLEKMVNK